MILSIRSVSIRAPFAAAIVVPESLSGGTFDYMTIPKYAAAVEAGAFDGRARVLLKKSEVGWEVLEYTLGAGDDLGEQWARDHGAPLGIFERWA